MTSGQSTGRKTAISVGSSAEARDDSHDRRLRRRRLDDDVERQLDVALADGEPPRERVAEDAPGALGQRLAREERERLRRAEARGRPTDEQHSGHVADRGFSQTETCFVLSLVNGSRVQLLQRSRSARPASRAIRSSSDGHTYRNGGENTSTLPPSIQ